MLCLTNYSCMLVWFCTPKLENLFAIPMTGNAAQTLPRKSYRKKETKTRRQPYMCARLNHNVTGTMLRFVKWPAKPKGGGKGLVVTHRLQNLNMAADVSCSSLEQNDWHES